VARAGPNAELVVTVNADRARLLELLACPACDGTLDESGAGLTCVACGKTFRAHDGVPALLVESRAATPKPSHAARIQYALLGSPRVYDLQQRYGGGRKIAGRVRSALAGLEEGTLLDIGAGTGMAASLVAPTTRYVWFDNDLLKLRGFLSRRVDGLAVLGSVERLPFRDEAFDWTLMVDVTHHLPDEVLDHALSEVARVTRRAFVFSDALRSGRRRSDLLWHLDLGRYPRTEGPLLDALGAYFTVESVERFRINHDHVLCVCVPRQGRDISLDQ
jgi:SAM-dependent methyltransferase